MKKLTFNRFTHWSKEAAKLEQAGKYADAAKAWDVAMLNAKGENKAWCLSRMAFCERMAVRPFKEGE